MLARGWWPCAVLFAGLLWLYPEFAFWPAPKTELLRELADKRAAWLNWPAFLARTAFVFVFLGWTAEVARRIEPTALARAGLHMLGLTLALFMFSVDWVMVGDGEWFSSAFPFIFMLLGVVAALNLALLPQANIGDPALRRDFSGLLQAALALTAYVAVMEFIIIWMGDLPYESVYYTSRANTPMRWVPVYVVVFGCALPFLSLFPASRRRDAKALRRASSLALSGVAAYLFWLTNPLY